MLAPSTPSSQRPRAPRWSLVVVAVVAITVPALGGAVGWLRRPHTIVYRASAPGCELLVRYSTHEGSAPPLRARDRWESGEIELVHGDVASLIATPGPGCEGARCEIVEDGVSVARAAGRQGAICSAATAR